MDNCSLNNQPLRLMSFAMEEDTFGTMEYAEDKNLTDVSYITLDHGTFLSNYPALSSVAKKLIYEYAHITDSFEDKNMLLEALSIDMRDLGYLFSQRYEDLNGVEHIYDVCTNIQKQLQNRGEVYAFLGWISDSDINNFGCVYGIFK